jgi:DNA-binding transcriptional ArsR family regulator
MEQITLRSVRQPTEENLDKDIEWFCESLGLLGERDRNKTSLKIFRAILNGSKDERVVSIEEIAKKAEVSRTAAIHHLKIMKNAGLIIKEGSRYELRVRSLQKLVDEIGLDIERILNSIREIAEDIDREMKLPVRPKKV